MVRRARLGQRQLRCRLCAWALAIRRRAAGTGLGRTMLRWAEREVAAAGRTYLRLDCMTANLALRSYYECAGFMHRGDVHGKTWSASRYEKRVEPA